MLLPAIVIAALALLQTQPDDRRLTRCEPTSPPHQQARVALEALDEKVTTMAPSDGYEPILAELSALLETRCFEMAVESGSRQEPDSAESLSEWWSSGGYAWLTSYLALPIQEVNGRRTPLLVVPPEVRQTLHTDGGLTKLICEVSDEACGKSTAGWRRRAEARLLDKAQASRREAATVRSCRDTLGEYDDNQYQAFRGCLEASLPSATSLRLGAIRAPTSGWLVVRGRRGHYEFCDEVRAYNLANGDAFRAASCSGLALEQGGTVDFARTRELANDVLDAGRVHLENLREAAWMFLMSAETDHVRRTAIYVEVPDDIPIFWLGDGTTGHGFGGGWGGSSGHTTLSWRVVTGGVDITRQLRWPSSYDTADDHAVELLKIAEDSWQPGCPKSAPPELVLRQGPPPISFRDADVDEVGTVAMRLMRSLVQWNTSSCGPMQDAK